MQHASQQHEIFFESSLSDTVICRRSSVHWDLGSFWTSQYAETGMPDIISEAMPAGYPCGISWTGYCNAGRQRVCVQKRRAVLALVCLWLLFHQIVRVAEHLPSQRILRCQRAPTCVLGRWSKRVLDEKSCPDDKIAV